RSVRNGARSAHSRPVHECGGNGPAKLFSQEAAMVEPKIFIEGVNYFYGDFQALRDITLEVPPKSVTVFFGPAAGGKTTLLRLINRLNDMIDDTRMTGRVLLDGKNVYDPGTNVENLRR